MREQMRTRRGLSFHGLLVSGCWCLVATALAAACSDDPTSPGSGGSAGGGADAGATSAPGSAGSVSTGAHSGADAGGMGQAGGSSTGGALAGQPGSTGGEGGGDPAEGGGAGHAQTGGAGGEGGQVSTLAPGVCEQQSDCFVGEVCAYADLTFTNKICKALQYHGMNGQPCNDTDHQCEELGFCGLFPSAYHYGVDECTHGGNPFTTCPEDPAEIAAFCGDASKSCFGDGILNVFCATACETSSDCADDQECRILDEQEPDSRFCGPKACHCTDRNTFCDDNYCVEAPATNTCDDLGGWLPEEPYCRYCEFEPKTGCGDNCNDDDDCAGGLSTCVNGHCDYDVCTSTADCDGGKICGVLSLPGRNAEQVASVVRACMPPGASALGGACDAGSDCASGQCYLGKCVQQCAKNADCDSGEECMVGPVVPADPPFCSERLHCGDCTANQYCDAWRTCQP